MIMLTLELMIIGTLSWLLNVTSRSCRPAVVSCSKTRVSRASWRIAINSRLERHSPRSIVERYSWPSRPKSISHRVTRLNSGVVVARGGHNMFWCSHSLAKHHASRLDTKQSNSWFSTSAAQWVSQNDPNSNLRWSRWCSQIVISNKTPRCCCHKHQRRMPGLPCGVAR